MKTELRYASNPDDFKGYDTERLRKEFLIENLFSADEISLVYSLYDRFIVGAIMPVFKELILESPEDLKAEYFLARREIGIINVGGDAVIMAEGKEIELGFKDALYIGKGVKVVKFRSLHSDKPAKLYFNSAQAHKEFPLRRITKNDAEVVILGGKENSNQRTVNKLIVNSVIETCQLQMGMTELKPGNVWNTMPPHTHNRRMEVYFYFEVPENQAVCHFIGDPSETRHIWMKNEQAVVSPSWSIHSAAGTASYSFIWGMAGENLNFNDMDVCNPDTLK